MLKKRKKLLHAVIFQIIIIHNHGQQDGECNSISLLIYPINNLCHWISHRQHFGGHLQHHRTVPTLQSEVDTSNQHERGVLRKLQTSGSSECHRAGHWDHNTYHNCVPPILLQSINTFILVHIYHGVGVPSRYQPFRCVLAYVQSSHKRRVRSMVSNVYDQYKVQYIDCDGVRSDHKPSSWLFYSADVTSSVDDT